MKNIEFTYNGSLVGLDEIKKTTDTISNYVEHVYSIFESVKKEGFEYKEAEYSVGLPFDVRIQKSVEDVVRTIRTKSLKYIIVVGIGGSNLGTKAVYDAIRGTEDSFLKTRKEKPKIIFADTTSPKLLKGICEILKENIKAPEDVAINIVSKSGSTTETIVNFEIIYSFLREQFKDDNTIKERIIVTTDYESKLWGIAKKHNFKLLSIPENVGGRYSVFSTVGLFPLTLAGINTQQLLAGARIMCERCTKKNVLENPALVSAGLIHIYNKKGISISNTFFFNPHLGSVGRWYRQLIGESIGKKYGIDGNEVNVGVTPIVSIGSTDLHSMAQLYFGGPRDKFTTFVYAPENNAELTVSRDSIFHDIAYGVEGKQPVEIMNAIFSGVKESYKKSKLPFVEIEMENTEEYAIGQFLQFKMLEIMYAASLFRVNAFDQPNVEDYKKEMKKILLTT